MAYNYNVSKRFSPERLIPLLLLTILYISWVLWANLADPTPVKYEITDFELGIGEVKAVDDITNLDLRKSTTITINMISGNGNGMYLGVLRTDRSASGDLLMEPSGPGVWSVEISNQEADLKIDSSSDVEIFLFHTPGTTSDVSFDFELVIDEPIFAATDTYIIAMFFLSLIEVILILANYSQLKFAYKSLKAKMLGKNFINKELDLPQAGQDQNTTKSDFDDAFDKAFK